MLLLAEKCIIFNNVTENFAGNYKQMKTMSNKFLFLLFTVFYLYFIKDKLEYGVTVSFISSLIIFKDENKIQVKLGKHLALVSKIKVICSKTINSSFHFV